MCGSCVEWLLQFSHTVTSYPFIGPSVCPHDYLFVCPSVCSFVRPFVRSYVYLYVCIIYRLRTFSLLVECVNAAWWTPCLMVRVRESVCMCVWGRNRIKGEGRERERESVCVCACVCVCVCVTEKEEERKKGRERESTWYDNTSLSLVVTILSNAATLTGHILAHCFIFLIISTFPLSLSLSLSLSLLFSRIRLYKTRG